MRNTLKKTFLALSIAVILLLACACGNAEQNTPQSESLSLSSNSGTQTSDSSNQSAQSNSSQAQASDIFVESVESAGEGKVKATLNCKVSDLKTSDLKLYAQTSDWYSLKSGTLLDRVNVTKTEIDNSGAKTAVIYTISNELEGVYLVDDEVKAVNYTEQKKQTILQQASNAITWQIPNNGGWDKDYDGHTKKAHVDGASYITKGWTVNNVPLGTIDNNGTYSEMRLIAEAYEISKESKYKESFDKAIAFLKLLQYPTGGFAQVYPRRGNYSDYVTINDDAMANVLILLEEIVDKKYPFENIVTDQERNEIKQMFDGGIQYLLNAQIAVNGKKTGWCAQHNPTTYEPMSGRDYERPSISGSESIGVIKLLLHQRDNAQAVEAAESAIEWFDSVKLENKAYNNQGVINSQTGLVEYIYQSVGSTIWYRFYDLKGVGFFSDRATNKDFQAKNGYFYDITEISEERRLNYSWMGKWPATIINVYKDGYFANRIAIKVVGTSTKEDGKTFKLNQITTAK